jgi:hypothetical protein
MLSVPSIIGKEITPEHTRSVTYEINIAHGFTIADIGKPIYMNGGVWAYADSDDVAKTATHVIEHVLSASKLRLISEGTLDLTSAFQPGTIIYVGGANSSGVGTLTTTVTNQKFGFCEDRFHVFVRLQNNNIDANVSYTKGDLVVHNGSNAQLLSTGGAPANDHYLVSNSAANIGLQWVAFAETVEAATSTSGSLGGGTVMTLTPTISSLFSPVISIYDELASSTVTVGNVWNMQLVDAFQTIDYRGARSKLTFNTTTVGSANATLSSGSWTNADISRIIILKSVYSNSTSGPNSTNFVGKALITSIVNDTIANITIVNTLASLTSSLYTIEGTNSGTSISLAGPPFKTSDIAVVCTTDNRQIDVTNWSALTDFNITANDNGQDLFVAIGLTYTGGDAVSFWIVDGVNPAREIVQKLSGGVYTINDDVTYTSSNFTASSVDDRLMALSEALALSVNQMTVTTLNGVSSLFPVISGTASGMLLGAGLQTADDALSPVLSSVSFAYNSLTKWRKNNNYKTLLYVEPIGSVNTLVIESDTADPVTNVSVYITD